MTKHLVDIDDDALTAARSHPGIKTTKDTINAGLRQAGEGGSSPVEYALDVLAAAPLADRDDAWLVSTGR